MREYLSVVQTVLDCGTRKENRTGVDTISTFNLNYEVDLKSSFPLLTTKYVSWKNIVAELLWFLSGATDISLLRKHGCKFWDPWADNKGFVPSAYGHFWREFPVQGSSSYNDQIKWVVEELKRNPMSRRLVVSAWDPSNAQTSKLPPCHCMFVLNVQNNKEACPLCWGINSLLRDYPNHWCLGCSGQGREVPRLNLHLTQRSCDVALGLPYNLASYSLLLKILARVAGMRAGTFAHSIVDAHVYTSKPDGSMAEYDHVPGLEKQLGRELRDLPSVYLAPWIDSLDDLRALSHRDTESILKAIQLRDYKPHPSIPFKVAV